jgi:formate C-acetyltransferase
MRVECKATIALAHRYADLAEDLAASAGTSERRAELLGIANVCRHVPEHPPSTFHEAVQAFWLVHYALFSTQTLISCGRPDQFLYPAFKKDLVAGSITPEQAQELIDCLWLRFNDRAQMQRENFFPGNGKNGNGNDSTFSSGVVAMAELREWPAGHRKRFMVPTDLADAINHWGQNLLLSGIRPDGTDGTNELTYLCLNAQEKFALTSPVVTARLHKDSPSELVHRTAEVLKSGGGMPYINNDDAIAQDYANLGVPLEDARDYANSNCWETMIQGRSDQELIRGVNFLLLLELALNRGYSHVHGERMGPDTGDPREFTSFHGLMEAWKTQMDHLVKQGIDYIGEGVVEGTLDHSSHGKYCYNPFLSSLTLDCIEKEMDVTRCGARYTIWHVMGEAPANATDSMAAIKKMVFEDRAVTMDQLLSALEADWQGHENLRRMLVSRAPKFANDDVYADDIGREMMDYFVERSRLHAKRWHPTVIFPCSVGTFSWITSIGREVAATPDGRRSGDPVAANLSPVPGSDTSGPTAAINSCVKMRSGDLAAGAPTDLRLAKSSLGGEAGTQRMAGLIKGFIDLGGNMLTLTVTDVEELKRAMEEPEKYRHLRVRMGGWSAYFVMLSREQQLLHIRRVEHGLA